MLVLEYARHGDLSTHLQHAGRASPKRRHAARCRHPEVLGKLIAGRCAPRPHPAQRLRVRGRKLKLGDFGIARPQTDRRGVTARTLNPFAAPSDILAGTAPKWQARDDVYQVGQLLGMLIRGDAQTRVRTAEIRHLACSDHLKEIFTAPRRKRKRYERPTTHRRVRNPAGELKAGAGRSLRACTSLQAS